MRGPAYYNEFDPYAAQWLHNLIAAGHIAPGDVDERNIVDVQPDDLKGYAQCHFFAGIGGWSLALRLAGWPDDRPVWTGSCPCQPFSVAGAQRGSDDERHLWPAFFRLIRERRPGRVYGEQVAGAAGLAWIDHVLADLEDTDYAAAAADLPACSVGAPHRRQRLFWVADAADVRCDELSIRQPGYAEEGRWVQQFAGTRDPGDLAHPAPRGLGINGGAPRNPGHAAQRDTVSGMADADGRYAGAERQQRGGQQRLEPEDRGAGLMDDAFGARLEGHRTDQGPGGWFGMAGSVAEAGPLDPWRDLEWIVCSDGKARPTQPGLFPLVDGISDGRVAIGRAIPQSIAALSEAEAAHRFNRVGTLRGAGNAIVPQVAAVFVMATDCRRVV